MKRIREEDSGYSVAVVAACPSATALQISDDGSPPYVLD